MIVTVETGENPLALPLAELRYRAPNLHVPRASVIAFAWAVDPVTGR